MKTLSHLLTEASFKYYYHVTFKKNVAKIKSKGLNPMQTSNWAKGDGQRYNEQGGVFAFQHPEDAWKWAFKMNWDFKKPISIVRIKKSKSWEKDPSADINLQMGKGDALQSISAISKSDIKDVFDFDDFGTPAGLGISQQEWIKGIVDKLK